MWQSILLSLLAFGVGLVLLLWGYRAFLAMLPIFGFFAGLWLGAHAISVLFGTGFLADVTGLVTGLVVGVILALLSYLFYALGVVVVAAAIGYGLGAGLMQAIGLSAWWLVIPVGILVGVLVVILTLGFNLQKYVVIALTAIAGANALVLSALVLFGRVTPGEIQRMGDAIQPVIQDSWFWGLAWIILAIAGVVYQIMTNRWTAWSSDDYVIYYT
jgi:hypothetical protein